MKKEEKKVLAASIPPVRINEEASIILDAEHEKTMVSKAKLASVAIIRTYKKLRNDIKKN